MAVSESAPPAVAFAVVMLPPVMVAEVPAVIGPVVVNAPPVVALRLVPALIAPPESAAPTFARVVVPEARLVKLALPVPLISIDVPAVTTPSEASLT